MLSNFFRFLFAERRKLVAGMIVNTQQFVQLAWGVAMLGKLNEGRHHPVSSVAAPAR